MMPCLLIALTISAIKYLYYETGLKLTKRTNNDEKFKNHKNYINQIFSKALKTISFYKKNLDTFTTSINNKTIVFG